MSPSIRLTSRIINPHDPDPSVEDILASALDNLFTDDVQQSHGVPGQSIVYQSPRFGDLHLQIPNHPNEEGGRQLFAHYLWNAGVITAEGIERGSCDELYPNDEGENVDHRQGLETQGEPEGGEVVTWEKRFWDMRGKDVLEFGAATALPSLIAALSHAHTVVSTDHPSSPAITANTIKSNFEINIINRPKSTTTSTSSPARLATTNTDISSDGPADSNASGPDPAHQHTPTHVPQPNHPPVTTHTKIQILGYAWGTTTFFDAQTYGKPISPQPSPESFDRIIIADCLWVPAQHENLIRSVLTYLKREGQGSETKLGNWETTVPCALVVAGFHTGREVVRDFIEIATGSPSGDGDVMNLDPQQAGGGDDDDDDDDHDTEVRGHLRAIDIFEVDIEGRRRPWEPSRPREAKERLKRWCMCAILVRR